MAVLGGMGISRSVAVFSDRNEGMMAKALTCVGLVAVGLCASSLQRPALAASV